MFLLQISLTELGVCLQHVWLTADCLCFLPCWMAMSLLHGSQLLLLWVQGYHKGQKQWAKTHKHTSELHWNIIFFFFFLGHITMAYISFCCVHIIVIISHFTFFKAKQKHQNRFGVETKKHRNLISCQKLITLKGWATAIFFSWPLLHNMPISLVA